MKKILTIIFAATLLPSLLGMDAALTSAQIVEQDVSGVYIGGHIRRNRPTTISNLRNSGFTTALLFNVHVDTDGTLMTDGETICKDGEYVFMKTQPNYVDDIKKLKEAPTSICRIEIVIGGWGNDSYAHIKQLINRDGTGEETILYRNFKALRDAIPVIDAVNNDQEQDYDASATIKFHKMMYSLGWKTTIAPYTNKTFWQSVATGLKNYGLDRIMIQCYDGGAYNNPSDWKLLSGVPVYGGRMYYQDTWDVPYHIEKFEQWRNNNGVTGGFVWVYNDESWDLKAWATGMNRIYKARSVSDDLVGARFYSDKNYGGYCVALPEGAYKPLDLILWGIAKNDIESIKVSEGYTVHVYKNLRASGSSFMAVEEDTPDLGTYNNALQSVVIERIENAVTEVKATPVDNTIYDIQGRKITTPTKGIYIMGGKKYVK